MAPEQSAVLTDPVRMRAVLQHHVPSFAEGGLVVDDCHIIHTRYRLAPGDRRHGRPFLAVGYEVDVHDQDGDGVRFLNARAYEGGRARDAYAAAEHEGHPVAYLPELDTVVWTFPDDPRLPHLAEVIDPEAVKRHLPFDDVDAVEVHVVRFKPEIRCTTRYVLHRGGRTHTIFGKTFRHGRAAEIHRRMQRLWEAAGDDGAFVVPRPLGVAEEVRTLWQDGMGGTPLMDLLGGDGFDDLVVLAARGLDRLHGSDTSGLGSRTPADRLALARVEAAQLAQGFPALRSRLAALVARLERDMATLPPGRDGLVHGDFLLKQLVLGDGRLGVFDFDHFARGDTAEDLANCLADLTHQGQARLGAVLLAAYRQHADVPPARLRWHMTLQLLLDAHYWHKRRRLDPAFPDELHAMLARAEQPPVG